jgi:hypothetical protein
MVEFLRSELAVMSLGRWNVAVRVRHQSAVQNVSASAPILT